MGALIQEGLEVIKIELGTDSVQRRRHPAFVAHLWLTGHKKAI